MSENPLSSEKQTKQRVELTWTERFATHNARVDPGDVVCSSCLQKYSCDPSVRHSTGPMLPPVCSLSTYAALKDAKKQSWWSTLTEQEQIDYELATDPVAWAAVRLKSHRDPGEPWTPEFYQIEPLRCTANKMLLLFGRQTGKCISSGNINTYDGGQIPVQSLDGKYFDVVSLKGTGIVPRRATVTKNIVKPCVRVTFTSGRSLEVSTDHPFKAFDRWTDAADLKPKDRIASIGRGVFGTTEMPDEEAEVLGFFGKLAKHKSVPIAIQTGTRRVVSMFLNRLFACDGWACVNEDGSNQIGYCSASNELARGVQELLFKFGIFSTIYEKFPLCEGKRFHAWHLLISRGEDIIKFANEINILGKEDAVARVVAAIRPMTDNEILDAPELRDWVGSDVLWDEVSSVEDIGPQQTYSVSILDTDNYDDQNFAVDGIFTHNTEVLVAKILNRLDTRPGYKILCVVPFQTQAADIYSRIQAFLAVSPDLRARVTRERESPVHEIGFDNGSRIRIFTAGERTGKSASDVRGQSADWLVLDEAAMLSDDTLVSIMATLTRARVPEIWVSSTPLEAVGRFHAWATNPMEGFRVFWIPSSSAPEWSDEIEMFYRRTYSKAHYAREYEAKFGYTEKGVFRKQDIEFNGVIVPYDVTNPAPNPIEDVYIFGVDWNSTGNGVVILVYAWSNTQEKFIFTYKEVIDNADFTQLSAVDRIVQLNAVWQPKYIYVDDGYGKVQVEVLKKYGIEHPQTGLHRKVKPIAMNSPIEIRDPLTRKKIKKQAKNLLVEMAKAKMEAHQCVFPKSEDHKDGILGQIRAYEVIKTTAAGLNVYSQGNEHLLTAWLLALGGFLIEFTDLTRVRLASDIVKMDPDARLIKQITSEADKIAAREERDRMEPRSRTEVQRRLDIGTSIKYAATGLPEGLKRTLNSISREPPRRKTW